jgi:hypothetical protein
VVVGPAAAQQQLGLAATVPPALFPARRPHAACMYTVCMYSASRLSDLSDKHRLLRAPVLVLHLLGPARRLEAPRVLTGLFLYVG